MNTEYQSLVAHATEVLALAKRLTEQNGELERLLKEARERELDSMPRRESRQMQSEIHSLKEMLDASEKELTKERDVVNDLRAQLSYEKNRADGNWDGCQKWRNQCAKAHEALRQTYRVALDTVYENNFNKTGKDIV